MPTHAARASAEPHDGLAASGRETERLTASLSEITRFTGISRSELYRLLASGRLRAVKSGARTLVLWNSVEEHLANLPPATFGGRV